MTTEPAAPPERRLRPPERRRVGVALLVAAALAGIAGLLLVGRSLGDDPLARLARSGDVWSGSIHLPRGGPYIFGYASPSGDDAELTVDGKVVASGPGERKARVVLAPGVVAFAFRGPPGTRLLWHPPGRRGALEYLPPSSVSPEPPARARFGPGAGAWRGHAAVAAGIVLLLAALGVGLAVAAGGRRRRLDRAALRRALPVLGVFALALAVRLATVPAFGQTWDEDEYWSAGRNYLVNLLAFDFSPHAWRWNHEHPPVTKYVAGLGALAMDGYGLARALFAALGAATAALAVGIGARLFGTRAGIMAGVAVALTPRLVGHDAVVGHEAPSVFFFTLAVALALRAHDGAPTTGRFAGRLAVVGVVLGLAVATRFANLLLAPLVGVVLVLTSPWGRGLVRTVLAGLAAIPLAAAATFFALWPRMWTAPIVHLRGAWQVLKQQHLPEYYLGAIVQKPPWHYFPVYLVVTAPLVLLVCAVVFGGLRAARRRERGMLVLLLWLLVPFGVAWSPVRQDGVRYILPALVPLALLAAAGADELLGLLRGARARAAVAAALGVTLAVAAVRIYPYFLDYYGEHVGGPAAVARARRFEIGWWGEGIGDAVDHVNRHAASDATVHKLLQPIHLNWLRADLWRDAGERSDWILANPPGLMVYEWRNGRPFAPRGHELVHVVRAQGAPLVWVYRRRP